MSIKYNEFGEVVFVNGLTTGQHLGTPMQDAIAEKPEDNEVYATERNTVTRIPNSKENWEKQPDNVVTAVKADLIANGQIGSAETNRVEIFGEQEVQFEEKFGYSQATSPLMFPKYDEIVVIWGGVEYKCKYTSKPSYDDINGELVPNGNTVEYYGNIGGLMPNRYPNTGEPFVIALANAEINYGMMAAFDEKLTVQTVAIYADVETVKPIDPKYLPFGSLPVVDLDVVVGATTETFIGLEDSENGKKLSEAMAQNLPCVIRFELEGLGTRSLCFDIENQPYGDDGELLTAFSYYGFDSYIVIAKLTQGGVSGWVAMYQTY